METGVASAEEIRQHIEKVVSSPLFLRSVRLCRFLRFTADQVVEGRGSQIKEYVVGAHVFDRGPGFDPRTDSIVRVEARRLRAKLKAYYDTEGSNDSVLIHFDPGSYTPVFRRRGEPGKQAAREPASLAVLPFANLSPDPGDEYFSDGLTEEIITSLAQAPGLRVVARTSSFQFKGKADDVREIGNRLGVANVLEGSVRKSGKGLRIAAQLISVADGFHLWAEAYDCGEEEVFSVQKRIARGISDALKIRFTTEMDRQAARRIPKSQEAYHCYLKGRHFWNMRTPDGMRKGLAMFQKAIATDQDYAVAYAGLADCLAWMAVYGLPPHEVMPKAREAALAALAIDGDLAEAHAALGAEKSFLSAIRINPGCVTIYSWYAWCLSSVGRAGEALEQIRVAQRLDPISPLINSLAGVYLMLARDYDAAIRQLQDTVELDPGFYRTYWVLGITHVARSEFHEAITALEKAADLMGRHPFALGPLGQCYGMCGRAADARLLLDELLQRSRREYVSGLYLALIHFGLGNTDEAFAYLERTVEERDPCLTGLNVWPVLDMVRSDPRFLLVQSKMGLQQS